MSSKPKLKPLAAALKLVDQLSDDEKLTLHDYLRPERKASKSPMPAQPAGGRSSRKPRAGGQGASTAAGKDGAGGVAKEPICVTCGNEEGYVDHSQPSPNYHAFETGKVAGAGGE